MGGLLVGVERGAGFYDAEYHPAGVPLLVNPWLGVWLLVCQWVEADPPPIVLDLGCGAGRFAELLALRGFGGCYVGVDFSEASIRHAEGLALGDGFSFRVGDLRDPVFGEVLPPTLVVLLEVLEHLGDDLGVIERLPSLTRVLFSVPNFDSAGHVRWLSPEHARERYSQLVEYRRVGTVDLSPPVGRLVTVFEGWRV